ncbi:hypothetical protein TPHA_0F01020 [Tetrapisispora phaffii CBS 4417]|uniref:AB hydrolase-1 domain-containing protein n=1 Tax=Tetrapisispora phaffii (strain ATCC 24235 / CBS 4417 / NBRC 1672 / NRRL Y-8282 / UCD 70-5) TaxID=1071381 RepID=G8BV06_TETPH|nr:hypothetical protein TPHA_0F01020 [Tetrapisispora phaffii CBS 4417]CCE63588.1 hypothetical protein TPHA_0F01020 [Tetrapisispora phaffii CBS 4417]
MMFSQTIRRISTKPRAIELAFDKIACKNNTNKTPLVLIHGLFGSKTSNRSMARSLDTLFGNSRDIYLIDLRNHGESATARPHDYESMSLDVFKFLQAHALHRSILVGHSMGGKVVMNMILQQQMQRKMACEITMGVCIENAPAVTMPNSKFVTYIDALQSAISSGGGGETSLQTRDSVHRHLSEKLPGEQESIIQFLMTLLRRLRRNSNSNSDGSGGGGAVFESKVPLQLLRESIVAGEVSGFPLVPSSDTPPCGTPMLFIRGEASNYLCDEYIVSISSFFANFEVQTVANSGHFVNSERPVECARLIHEYIDRRED